MNKQLVFNKIIPVVSKIKQNKSGIALTKLIFSFEDFLNGTVNGLHYWA